MRIHRKTAQAIAESTSEVLGHGVLVTDGHGIIIGCNDRSRVGTLHAPSLDVLSRGEPLLTTREEAAELDAKPGYTAPISLSGQLVGTVSISGLPREVERYGRLVRRQAEVLLMEQSFLELRLRRQWAVHSLAESIMLYRAEDDDADAISSRGHELGFDLGRRRVAAILDFRATGARRSGDEDAPLREMVFDRVVDHFPGPDHIIAPLRGQRIVLFLALARRARDGEMEEEAAHLCSELADRMAASRIWIEAGIGREAEGVAQSAWSAHLAREALGVGRALGMRICPSRELAAEMLVSYLSPSRKRQHIEHVLGERELDPELTETFLAWCRSPFSAARVTRELSIHRNTLRYRLCKLRDITGLDPWSFHDAFALWSASILRKFERAPKGGA
ncbi:MAG: helix-turn-helix domain-containing protein [Synergistaceae bacterium]|nr:helix-turn-helix domain-containing protein [Synergistaceae bacterium]